MPDDRQISRRSLLGGSVGAAGIGLVGEAMAAEPAAQQPRALFGAVEHGQVSLPPLHAGSELNGSDPNPDPVARRLGVAVVGLGHLALEQILPAFGQAKHVRLAALVSGERDKAVALAAQYGVPASGIYGYDSFESLRENLAVDIVYIVLPNAMHLEYTRRAAAIGKHVLCEKPMANSVTEAEQMIDACRKSGVKLMIAYRMQYDPANRALTEMARSQAFGPIRLIEAVNGQNDAANGQWRQIRAMAGGGSLPDVGTYCLNAARYLTGEEPVAVTGIVTRPKDDPRFAEVEDICAFTLRFPSGIVATCASGYSFHENRQLRVSARDAWFGLDPAFGYNHTTLHVGRKIGQSSGEETRRFAPKNQFALEMDAFAEALRNNREPYTPGEEGLADMKVIEAIYKSAANGGAVVAMPEVRRLDSTRGPRPADVD